MIETTQRPASPSEREALSNIARSATSGAGIVRAAVIGFILGFVAGMAAVALFGLERRFREPIATGCGLLLGALLVQRARRDHARGSVHHEELAAGEVEVTRYLARSAIRVEEFEDEGSAWYLLLQDGRVLFLMGQYLYDAEEEGRFPCTTFTIVRTPRTRLVLDLECSGETFQSAAERSHFTEGEFNAQAVPDDGAVLDVDFDTLLARFR
jgi:hypothetical protein